MGERVDTRVSTVSATDRGGRLRELCATTADARRQLAASAPHGPGDLQSRLVAIAHGLSGAEINRRDRASLMVFLDEIGGLVGQLELEREAARARIVALDRHRQAQLSYAKGRRPK
jgi:hypothetical protein